MYRVVEGPAAADEPLTLAELREHLSLSMPAGGAHPDDALIQRLGRAARAAAEQYTEQAYAKQVWEVAYDGWVDMLSEGLPGGRVNSIVSITYRDDLNAETALPAEQFVLDEFTRPARVREGVNATTWPALGRHHAPVVVRIQVGEYPDKAIPEDVKAAMLLIVGDLYEHREDTSPAPLQTLPNGARALLAPHRIGLGV